MRVLVTYHSETGNTEKLAQAIFSAIDLDKELIPLEELRNPEGYDVIFCGFPVHARGVPAKVRSFFERLPRGQRVALFITHGSFREGPLTRQAMEQALSAAGSANVIGTFSSRGAVDAKLLDAIKKQPAYQAWAREAQSAEGHPNAADLAEARAFAKEMIRKGKESA